MLNIYSRAYKLLCRLYSLVLGKASAACCDVVASGASAGASAGVGVRAGVRAGAACPVTLDSLETRCLFSAFTVSSLGDRPEILTDGDGNFLTDNLTLREAIMLANIEPGHDEILFSKSLASKNRTINLEYGPLDITDSLTIASKSGTQLTLVSTPAEKTVVISYSSLPQYRHTYTPEVEFDGVNITGRDLVYSYTDYGNTYKTVYGGGGLIVHDATLRWKNSSISGNTSYSGIALEAIYSNLYIDNCTIANNKCNYDYGVGYAYGAVAAYNSYLTINNSKIKNNDAGLILYGSQAAITKSSITGSKSGSGICSIASNVGITSSSITGNTAYCGGGINAVDSSLTIRDSAIDSNKIVMPDDELNAFGAGIAAAGSTIQMEGSSVNNNKVSAPASFYKISVYGIGMYMAYCQANIYSSSISGNTGLQGQEYDSRGGGIHATDSQLLIAGSRIAKNAIGQGYGGGVNIEHCEAVIAGSTIESNKITGATDWGEDKGGGINISKSSASVYDSKISSNSVSGYRACGGGISIFDQMDRRASYDSIVTISGCTISGNNAKAPSFRYDGYTYSGYANGGGIYAENCTIYQSTISGNKVTSRMWCGGGGIYAWDCAIYQSTISGNKVAGNYYSHGGGIYAESGTIDRCSITDNTLQGGYYTGGSGVSAGYANISNSIITGNHCKKSASGHYASYYREDFSGTSISGGNLANCTIIDNTSSGCHTAGVQARSIYNSIIWDNNAKSNAEASNLTFANTISNSLIDGRLGLSTIMAEYEMDKFVGVNGNLIGDFDPKFTDPDHGDYTPRFNSPAHDAGDNDFVYAPDFDINLDFAGNARIVNIVDMGALEHQSGPGSEGGWGDGGQIITISKSSPAKFHDFNDHLVKISMSGPGICELYLPGEDYCDPTLLSLTGTTTATKISVKSSSGETTIENVQITGDLKSFSAPKASLTGYFDISGVISKLVLSDVCASQQSMALNSAGGDIESAKAVKIILGSVIDMSLDTGGLGVASLKLESWLDRPESETDLITAAWIGSLKVTDGYKDPAADFQADITLSGENAPKNIALKKFKAADVDNSSISVENLQSNGLYKLTVDSWTGGSINAPAIKSLRVYDDVIAMSMELTRCDMNSCSLTKAVIGGSLDQSTWRIAGDMDVLKITESLSDTEIFTGGNISLIKMAAVADVNILAGVPMDFALAHAESADQFDGLRSDAATIDKLKITGKNRDTKSESLVENLNITAGAIGKLNLMNLDTTADDTLAIYIPFYQSNVEYLAHKDKRDADQQFKWESGEFFPQWLDNPITVLDPQEIDDGMSNFFWSISGLEISNAGVDDIVDFWYMP